MTRSKIFLGLTTTALAIAGVAVAKRTVPITRFYITFLQSACHAISSPCSEFSGIMTCIGTYTDGIWNEKSGPLFTQGGSSTVVVPANKCKNKIRYDGTL